jgi:ketosteroid isomerase-like protein
MTLRMQGIPFLDTEPDSSSNSRTLRTTQAYRRENGEWRLILGHASIVSPEDEARERALRAG